MSDTLAIGVDHGYAAMKSAHVSFPTGLVEYEHEPYTQQDVLEYNGKFYVVGSGRQPLQKDKTLTDDYYLLTLAAVAKELACRKKLFSIYSTTQECDIIVGQKIVGQKGVETDEKKLSK